MYDESLLCIGFIVAVLFVFAPLAMSFIALSRQQKLDVEVKRLQMQLDAIHTQGGDVSASTVSEETPVPDEIQTLLQPPAVEVFDTFEMESEPAEKSQNPSEEISNTDYVSIAPSAPWLDRIDGQSAMATDESTTAPESQLPDTIRTFTEGMIGRNVLGIAASILIFLGLIFLGVLVYEYLTEGIKIALMFALSTAITALGVFLSVKKRNAFSTSLMGCGCGAFFISILLTHLYFNRISDIFAFSILLVWLVLVLVLTRRFESMTLSIIAHVGMILAICLAYGLALSDEKLLLLLAYQIVASAVLVVGNTLCYRKNYRFGLFVTLGLTIIASMFMWERFHPGFSTFDSVFAYTELPTWIVAISFFVQFICASCFSYLIAISTNRLKRDDLRMPIHIGNKLTWTLIFFMNIYQTVYLLISQAVEDGRFLPAYIASPDQIAWLFAGLAALGVAFVHALLTAFMNKKLGFKKELTTISILLLSIIVAFVVLLFWLNQFGAVILTPHLSYLFIPALFLFLMYGITKYKVLLFGGIIYLLLDFVFMLGNGYSVLSQNATIGASLAYMALYPVVLWGIWTRLDDEKKAALRTQLILATALIIELSILSILLTSELDYRVVITLLVMASATIALVLFRFSELFRDDSGEPNYLDWFVLINKYLWVLAGAAYVAFAYKDFMESTLGIVLFLLVVVLAFSRIKELFAGSADSGMQIVYGIMFTGLTLTLIYGYTDWLDRTYVVSLICMITALVCIVTGFIWRLKTLRMYGLILTLLCVLKLVTNDVADLDTLMRVIALIGGGVICFIISAIYTYSSKRFEHTEG